MTVKESNTADGDYVVEIKLSHKAGDRWRTFESTGSTQKLGGHIPLLVAYNMGKEFEVQSHDSKKQRVLAMLKMIRAGISEVMDDIGKPIGVKAPGSIRRKVEM